MFKKGGISNGIELQIGPLINYNKYPTTFSSGLKVYIHNNSFEPTSSEVIYVQTGTQANIGVKRSFLYNYPDPYSNCIDLTSFSSELYNFMRDNNKVYRRSDCFELCLQRAIINTCGCFTSKFNKMNANVSACLNISQYDCLITTTNSFISGQANCLADCPLECTSVKYDVSLSSLDYPNSKAFEVIFNDKKTFARLQSLYNQTLTFDVFKKSFVSLNIYYPYVQYTKITEMPKITSSGVFSSVGGSLGMFVGFSIFSVLESLEIVIRMVKILIN